MDVEKYPRWEEAWLKLSRELKDERNEVLQRATEAVRKSESLWVARLAALPTRDFQEIEKKREVFEEAIEAVGEDWASDLIWHEYSKFLNEFSTGKILRRKSEFFREIFACAIKSLPDWIEKFRDWATLAISEDPLSYLLEDEEFLASEFHTDPSLLVQNFVSRRLKAVPWELRAQKEIFEVRISRSKWHLEKASEVEKVLWRSYIRSMAAVNVEAVEEIMKRAISVFNDDAGFWEIYGKFLVDQNRTDHALELMNRATEFFVKDNPEMLILASMFMELKDVHAARSLHRRALRFPSEAAVYEAAAFEFRNGDGEAGMEIFREAGEKAKIDGYFDLHAFFLCALARHSDDDKVKEECRGLTIDNVNLQKYIKGDVDDVAPTKLAKLRMELEIARFTGTCRTLLDIRERLVLAEDEEFANDKKEVTQSPPQPVRVAPASITRVASSSVKRRPPPGYTPSWQAEQYAKKHKI